jgi:hypothetical protein
MLCFGWIKHFMITIELRSCGLCGQEIIFPFSHSCLRLDFRWIPRNVSYMKSCEVLHLISVNRPLRPWTVFSNFLSCDIPVVLECKMRIQEAKSKHNLTSGGVFIKQTCFGPCTWSSSGLNLRVGGEYTVWLFKQAHFHPTRYRWYGNHYKLSNYASINKPSCYFVIFGYYMLRV